MAYDLSNAVVKSPDNSTRVISEEEILQGAFNSTQDGINVTMKAGSVLPLPTGAATSPSRPRAQLAHLN